MIGPQSATGFTATGFTRFIDTPVDMPEFKGYVWIVDSLTWKKASQQTECAGCSDVVTSARFYPEPSVLVK